MAYKDSQVGDSLQNTFQGLWKLKDSVKVRISTENIKSTRNGAEHDQIQETKVSYIIACASIASYIHINHMMVGSELKILLHTP